MRPKERIDNFINLVNYRKLEERWELPEASIPSKTKFGKILRYWNLNPDQRFGQVLINLGLVPDNWDVWTDEEFNILIDQGIAPEECLYWTSLYDKDENLLKEPITRLIKDLEPNHIKKILKGHYKRLSENYRKAFDNVLQKYCPGITYDIE